MSSLISICTKVRADSRRLLLFRRIFHLGLLPAETNQSGDGIKSIAEWAAQKFSRLDSRGNPHKSAPQLGGTRPAKGKPNRHRNQCNKRMLMKRKSIPPAVESNNAPLDAETRPENSSAALAMPASADLSETDAKRFCETARFGPFGPFRFRINVKPGRSPRFACRILRKDGAAGYFRAMTHV